jgi:hypothetical protein
MWWGWKVSYICKSVLFKYMKRRNEGNMAKYCLSNLRGTFMRISYYFLELSVFGMRLHPKSRFSDF